MKFSTREDIEAPIEFVFDEVSDFDRLERQALRRGVKFKRVSAGDANGLGLGWHAKVNFRGKPREVDAEISEVDVPNGYTVSSKTSGIEAVLTVELVALSRQRTRLAVGLEVTPRSLSGRLLVQSLKLAKASLQRRFDNRIADYAQGMGERYSDERGAV